MDLSEKKSFAVLCNLPIYSHNAVVWQLVNSEFLNLVGPSVIQGDGRVPWTHPGVAGLRTHSDLGQQSTGTSQGGKLGPTVPAGQRETCWQEFF